MHQDSYKIRLLIVACFLTLGFAALAVRLYWVQVVRHDELFREAKKKYTASRTAIGSRGLIYDVHGNLLAGNLACRDVLAEPHQFADQVVPLGHFLCRRLNIPRDVLMKKLSLSLSLAAEVLIVKNAAADQAAKLEAELKRRKLAGIQVRRTGPGNESWDVYTSTALLEKNILQLSEILGSRLKIPPDYAKAKLTSAFQEKRVREIVLARGLEIKAAESIEAELNSLRIQDARVRGIRFVDSTRRHYPKNSLSANLIGFTDNVHREGGEVVQSGVCGVEKMQDARLQPTRSRTVYQRDRHGAMIPFTQENVETARNGADIFLTMDETVQQIVEKELAVMVEQYRPQAAYAVMANPKTGAVLAMAQIPTFNPNDRSHMQPQAWKNRILVEGFEPGSIMKAMVIAGALDAGMVTPDSSFNCENGLWFYHGRSLRDSGHRYGVLHVWEIIQKSSNIGTAKIALLMGEQRVFDTLTNFGFGQPTGIGLEGEAPGIFRSLEKWDGLSITRFPIGQGILVTPLQMVQAYCALANGGLMCQLRVIHRVVDSVSGVAEVSPTRVRRRVVKEDAVRDMVQALKLVTREGGTALRAAVPGYDVAGKTGTAQKVVGGQYSSSKFVASFIGFVPADAPAFVLLVVADEPDPKRGYYGGTVAGPTFSRIAEKTLRYLQIAPATPSARPLPLQPEAMAVPDNEEADFTPVP